MVPKAEVDLIHEQQENNMLALQQEYENRLTQLAASLESLQNEQLEMISKTPNEAGKRSVLQGWTEESGTKAPPASRELGPVRWRGKRPQTLPEWGANLPKDFFDRMKLFEEEKATNRQDLSKKTRDEVEEKLLKQLASQYKLRIEAGDTKAIEKDVCLPAVFMPSKAGALYNPRAHHYFHPTGSLGQLRLTQPPSMFQLPPLPPNNRMSVINLFDIKRNFEQAMGIEATEEDELDGRQWESAPNTPSQFYSQPGTPHTPAKLDEGFDSERQSVA